MKNHSLKVFLLVVSAMLLLSACHHRVPQAADGSSPASAASDKKIKEVKKGKKAKEENSAILSKVHKGQSAKEVLDALGKPDQKSISANGTKVWEYKKASDMAENKLLRIGSFGLMGGKNSGGYADILTVYFNKSNTVTNFDYEEHVSMFRGR